MTDLPEKWWLLTLALVALAFWVGRLSKVEKPRVAYADAEKAVNEAMGIRQDEAKVHSRKKLTRPLEKARTAILGKLGALPW